MVNYIPSRLCLAFSTWLINDGYRLSRDDKGNIMMQKRIKKKKKAEVLTGLIFVKNIQAETFQLNSHAQQRFYKFCEIYSYRGREFITELEKQNPKNARIVHV